MLDYERYDRIRAVQWQGDSLRLLDQRCLPFEERFVTCRSAFEVAEAIRTLIVRGAPAIGIAAAYGIVLAARAHSAADGAVNGTVLTSEFQILQASRPTAINLFWALDRMRRIMEPVATVAALEAEAHAIECEDLAANRVMGRLGAALIAPGSGVLTHCNTGSLATAGFGTALGVIRAGYAEGRITAVYHTETRPWLQGARLTAWEFLKDGIPARLIADAAAAHLLKNEVVQWVIVGADRIAANGDTANKIGTYQLAILAKHHGVKFMVVASSSSVDMATRSAASIDIEFRNARELLEVNGQRVAAEGVQAWNPVFDVVPADLIDVVVTERGVIQQPDADKLRALFAILA